MLSDLCRACLFVSFAVASRFYQELWLHCAANVTLKAFGSTDTLDASWSVLLLGISMTNFTKDLIFVHTTVMLSEGLTTLMLSLAGPKRHCFQIHLHNSLPTVITAYTPAYKNGERNVRPTSLLSYLMEVQVDTLLRTFIFPKSSSKGQSCSMFNIVQGRNTFPLLLATKTLTSLSNV